MNAMTTSTNVPVCDACEAPKISIKDRMFNTQEHMLRTLDVLAAIRCDIAGGPKEKTQAPEISCMADAAEALDALSTRIMCELEGIAVMLGVRRQEDI